MAAVPVQSTNGMNEFHGSKFPPSLRTWQEGTLLMAMFATTPMHLPRWRNFWEVRCTLAIGAGPKSYSANSAATAASALELEHPEVLVQIGTSLLPDVVGALP